jgi:SAM-dependent methyltransferase
MENSVTKTFKEKWEHHQLLAFEETLREGSEIFTWILERNGFANANELKKYLRDKERLLDAGCGNGRVTALLRRYSPKTTAIVGVDLVSSDVAKENLETHALLYNISFLNRNLLEHLEDLGKFDFIYCQEVLHHLPDPFLAFQNLCKLLSSGGEIAIYVYKKKAPIREFVDDYIRDKISCLPYDEAFQVCKQITDLGRVLSQTGISIHAPQIEVLEIEGGVYDLQRFLYHFFMKCFWNPNLTFLENAAINFDWYHPQIASRHTIEEVRGWFKKEGLTLLHEHVDFYGITVRGRSQ